MQFLIRKQNNNNFHDKNHQALNAKTIWILKLLSDKKFKYLNFRAKIAIQQMS